VHRVREQRQCHAAQSSGRLRGEEVRHQGAHEHARCRSCLKVSKASARRTSATSSPSSAAMRQKHFRVLAPALTPTPPTAREGSFAEVPRPRVAQVTLAQVRQRHRRRHPVLHHGPREVAAPARTSSCSRAAHRQDLRLVNPADAKVEVPAQRRSRCQARSMLGGVAAWAWPFGGDDKIGQPAMTVACGLRRRRQANPFVLKNGERLRRLHSARPPCRAPAMTPSDLYASRPAPPTSR